MAIVSFEQIAPVLPSQVLSLIPDGDGLPLGPVAEVPGRTTLYDPIWGYFLFGQQIDFQYDDTSVYKDQATFTLRGSFTANAERGAAEIDLADDAGNFAALTSKLKALESIFETAIAASAPTDYRQWGTATDPRCLKLPDPLRDKDGKSIYALPVSLEVEPGQFPKKIAYRAVLREAKFSSSKLQVNGILVDNATLEVVPPSPRLFAHRLVAAAGAVYQLENYSVLEVQLSATLPMGTDNNLPPTARRLLNSLEAGTMQLALAGDAAGPQNLWEPLDVDRGSGLELALRDRLVQINLTGKAR